MFCFSVQDVIRWVMHPIWLYVNDWPGNAMHRWHQKKEHEKLKCPNSGKYVTELHWFTFGFIRFLFFSSKLKSISRALLTQRDRIPDYRLAELKDEFLELCPEESEITDELLQSFNNIETTWERNRKYLPKTIFHHKNFLFQWGQWQLFRSWTKSGRSMWISESLRSSVFQNWNLNLFQKYKATTGLVALERMWREHFLRIMKPKFLPEFWSLEHNVQRYRYYSLQSNRIVNAIVEYFRTISSCEPLQIGHTRRRRTNRWFGFTISWSHKGFIALQRNRRETLWFWWYGLNGVATGLISFGPFFRYIGFD